MVTVPLDYLRNPATTPLPFNVTPAQGAIAVSAYESSRALLRSNTPAFVARPRVRGGVPVLDAVSLALSAWRAWSDEVLFAPITFLPPPMTAGITYRITGRLRWDSSINTFNVVDIGDGPNGILTGDAITSGAVERVRGSGPTAQRELVVTVQNEFGVTTVLPISESRGAEFWTSVQLLELNVTALTGPAPGPLVFPPTFPLMNPPTVMPPQRVPLIIPVAPIPGIIPVPTRVPGYLPEPWRFPNSPIPFVPDLPSEEDDPDSPIPPITITPDGIEIGAPGGAITAIPGTGTITISTPQTQERREAERRGPAPCIDIDIEPPGPDCCDCEDIREIVIEELDSKFPPKRPNVADTIEYGSANSRTIELPDFCEYVRIIVNDAPANRKTQSGGNGAANVYYNGWCSFGSLGTEGERLPVHYDDATYFAPTGAKFFSYTLYHGTTATLQVKYRRET